MKKLTISVLLSAMIMLIDEASLVTLARAMKIAKDEDPEVSSGFSAPKPVTVEEDMVSITGVLGFDGHEDSASYSDIAAAVSMVHAELEPGKPMYLRVNSPGGAAQGIDMASDAIAAVAEEREVIGVVDTLAVSGGYWLVSQCSKIVATSTTTRFGSIGAVTTAVDFTRFYAEFGIDIYDITNPESKDKRPELTTEDGRKVYADMAQEYYQLFEEAVTAGRGMKASEVRELNGRVVLATKAMKVGLIDDIVAGGVKSLADVNQGGAVSTAADTRENVMDFETFLKENPQAAAQLDKMKAEAAGNGKTEAMKVAEENMKAVSAFVLSDKYSNRIKEAAMSCIAGKRSVDAVKDLVAVADEYAERDAADATKDDPGADVTTPTADIADVSKEKAQMNLDADFDDIAGAI